MLKYLKTNKELRDKIRQRDKFIDKLYDEKYKLSNKVKEYELEITNLREALAIITNNNKAVEAKKKISTKRKSN